MTRREWTEESIAKAKCCSICGAMGHNRRTCPGQPTCPTCGKTVANMQTTERFDPAFCSPYSNPECWFGEEEE